MFELKDWIKQLPFPDKPWLVLGKGPTFSRRSEFDLSSYNILSLNHVVREEKVQIAHIIDIDVVEACADKLEANCEWLIVPRVPNVKHFPGQYLTLSDWAKCIPALAEMEKQGRLITYDFSHTESTDAWTVIARYFSSELALGILGRMGVKKIVSLGIDGGTSYSASFSDLQKETLLANGQPSFDLQFDRLKELAAQLNIDYKPLILQEQTAKAKVEAVAPATENREYHPRKLLNSTLSVPEKIQAMEQEIRELREFYKQTRRELSQTAKELGITRDRLGWAREEIDQYRVRVNELERGMHGLVQSKTWKLGRIFTKPADVLTKKLHKN